MLRSISVTIFVTFLGQALAFAADLFIAGNFGTSWKADAYFLALIIPLMLSDFFIVGINSVFIPMYMGYRKEGKEGEFFNALTTVILLASVAIGVLAFLLAPYILNLIAGGFSSQAKDLTIFIARVLLVLVVTMPLAAVLSNLLNAHGRFAVPALGKAFYAGFVIVFLILSKDALGVFALPAGYIAGSVTFLAVMMLLYRGPILRYSFSLDLKHPALKELFTLLLPFLIANLANYVSLLVERSVASGYPEGSIAALNYAFKVINIPINLFVLAGLSVMLPTLSQYVADGDFKRLRELVLKGLGMVSFCILPMTVGFAIFKTPMVTLLFERGEFTAASSALTSEAMLYYSFGIVGLAAVFLMCKVFFAIKDVKTFCIIELCIIVFNIALILMLSRLMGFIGIPMTYSIMAIIHMLVMMVILEKRLSASFVRPFLKAFFRHAVAAVFMGAVCIVFMLWADAHMYLTLKADIAVVLFAAAALGVLSYGAVSYFLKVDEAVYFINKCGLNRKFQI